MKVIAVANQKGGVAKTTTSLNIGAGLMKAGKSVLFVDLDPQGNLSDACGVKIEDLEEQDTIFGVLRDRVPAMEIIQQNDWLPDIIPANINLSVADITLSSMLARERLLLDALNKVEGYDICIIDCPPALSLLTINAFTAADSIYVPVQPEIMGVKGIKLLTDTVENMKAHLNPELTIGGVIITLYDRSTNVVKECMSVLTKEFGDKIFKTKIRKNVRLVESPIFKQSIFDYDEKCHGAEDYGKLVAEIIEREQF